MAGGSVTAWPRVAPREPVTPWWAEPIDIDLKTGEFAVRKSEAIADLQQTSQVSADARQTMGRRTFSLRAGIWIGEAWKKDTPTIRVVWASAAQFRLLDRESELRRVFAPGERVVVVLPSGKAVEVGAAGTEDLGPTELDALFTAP